MTNDLHGSEFELTKDFHISPYQGSFDISFFNILMEIYHVFQFADDICIAKINFVDNIFSPFWHQTILIADVDNNQNWIKHSFKMIKIVKD